MIETVKDHGQCDECKSHHMDHTGRMPKWVKRKIQRIDSEFRRLGADLDIAFDQWGDLRLKLTLPSGDTVLLPNWSKRLDDGDERREYEEALMRKPPVRATYQREIGDGQKDDMKVLTS